MSVKNDTSTRFVDEIRIISPWAYFIALLAFLSLPTLLVFVARFDRTNPPIVLLGAAGIVAGTFMACYVLLIGYVNRDAGRRGMNRILWTLLAIFIPNALGIVLYFVLRNPRRSNCPQCSAALGPGFGFCSRCGLRLGPACPQCQRSVNSGDRFCPYCGVELGAASGALTGGERRNQ